MAMLEKREWERLVAEATAPLTPAEQEIKGDNVTKSQWWSKVVELTKLVEDARKDFCKDALLKQVEKGDVPQWVLDPEHGEEARGWLKEHGYHWQIDEANPFWMALCKGDRRVAELNISLTSDAPAQ